MMIVPLVVLEKPRMSPRVNNRVLPENTGPESGVILPEAKTPQFSADRLGPPELPGCGCLRRLPSRLLARP